MLNSLEIANYRLFKKLHLPHLARVNLIVGKNNVGKTCLLESLHIFASGGHITSIADSLERRTECLKHDKMYNQYDNPVRRLFFEQGKFEDAELIIRSDNRFVRIARHGNGDVLTKKAGDILYDALHLYIETEQGNRYIFNLLDSPVNRVKYHGLMGAIDYGFIHADGIDEYETARLWDKIDLTSLKDDVVSFMQIVDSGIIDVSVISDGASRVPYVRSINPERKIPLRSMGDGITRLFHIALSMVNAKEGVLLIDEFENGLHWSVQRIMWSYVFKLAQTLNVQVFATTHSLDCVKAFHRAWQDEGEATFYRLHRRKDGDIEPIRYSRELLGDALETDVEMR